MNHAPQKGKKQRRRQPRSVITCRELAQKVYTAKYLFALARRQEKMKAEHKVKPARAKQMLVEAMAEWEGQTKMEKAFWHHEARKHDEKQPAIADLIVEVFKANPTLSFNAAAAHEKIGNWCSGNTIGNLFRSLRYSTIMERILPLLTKKQMKEAVKFCKFLRSNWGRGGGKYLYITFDEKWFYGLVLRHAKLCEAFGLKRQHLYAKHKNHITQTMLLAITGYAFEDNMENGGTGVLLGIHRIEGARVAQRGQRETEYHDDGSHTFTGPWKRKKGDVHFVDCALTASSTGTSDKPSFSCLQLFELVFEQIEKVVSTGGKGSKYPRGPFAGHTPMFQPDNGPGHIGAEFLRFVEGRCATLGWGWVPQSAQCPFLNPQDLYVFPMMSRNHSRLLRDHHGKTPPSPDVIAETAIKLFWSLPSAAIAEAHVLAYRVAQKVIKERGGNHFLDEDGVHAGIRRDFYRTDTGIKRVDGKTFGPPPAS